MSISTVSSGDADIFYPLSHITINISMIKVDDRWQPVWDNPGDNSETWLVDHVS